MEQTLLATILKSQLRMLRTSPDATAKVGRHWPFGWVSTPWVHLREDQDVCKEELGCADLSPQEVPWPERSGKLMPSR